MQDLTFRALKKTILFFDDQREWECNLQLLTIGHACPVPIDKNDSDKTFKWIMALFNISLD